MPCRPTSCHLLEQPPASQPDARWTTPARPCSLSVPVLLNFASIYLPHSSIHNSNTTTFIPHQSKTNIKMSSITLIQTQSVNFGRGGYNGPVESAPVDFGRGGYNKGPDDDEEEDGRGGYN
ncbi:hypothetical protein B7463_g4138, partial [Scytalidium lignicola]